MWNKPTIKQLQLIPDLLVRRMSKTKIYMKFFIGSWRWYVAEIDHKNWDRMFCFVTSPIVQMENGVMLH